MSPLQTLPLLSATPQQIMDRKNWLLELSRVQEPNLRISIYEQPDPQKEYVLGFDAGYGLIGRDFDTICVLCKDTNPIRQVAEFQGHIGERLDAFVYAFHRYYNDAFVVGERQVGLATLRRLYDVWNVRWLYYDRTESQQARRITDKLGYHQMQRKDLALMNLRRAVVERIIELRSTPLIEQMHGLQFVEKTVVNDERGPDEKLVIKLDGGGSPDLVYACNYAWHGIREVPNFVKPPKPLFAPGTYGEIFKGHEELLPPEQRPQSEDGFENLGRGGRDRRDEDLLH